MSVIKKVSAELTLDDGGHAEEVLNARSGYTPSRYVGLYGVRVTHEDPKNTLYVTVREAFDLDSDGEYTYGDPLFGIAQPRSEVTYSPREETQTSSGASTGEENGVIGLRSQYIEVAIDGGTADGEVEVEVYLLRAGDQRF